MSYCSRCGYEVRWCTIEGKRIPMGCRCDYGDAGMDQFLRDFAVPTKCPKCGQPVFFVRHNKGSVWFDELGSPWWKHGCFEDPTEKTESKSSLKTKFSGPIRDADIGEGTGEPVFILKLDETDLGQSFIYVSLDSHAVPLMTEPGFWLRDPQPGVGDQLLLDRAKTTIQVLPGNAEYRYWVIDVHRCSDCGDRYLNHSAHKARCTTGRTVNGMS